MGFIHHSVLSTKQTQIKHITAITKWVPVSARLPPPPKEPQTNKQTKKKQGLTSLYVGDQPIEPYPKHVGTTN